MVRSSSFLLQLDMWITYIASTIFDIYMRIIEYGIALCEGVVVSLTSVDLFYTNLMVMRGVGRRFLPQAN